MKIISTCYQLMITDIRFCAGKKKKFDWFHTAPNRKKFPRQITCKLHLQNNSFYKLILVTHVFINAVVLSVESKLTVEMENVPHIHIRVHTVLVLTSDLTNCQSRRKRIQLVLLLLSPCTRLTLQALVLLYEKMPMS